ncbi:metal-dependent hydrolase [Desulfovibrio aerotolerans]|uniref:Metal-dependent hydrolase n=1 Tax=Solidesulfovibrio aerotolerans TaxID=295255 RepID=A0A7C9ILT3_9BACT|nr:metal-dependent hydrolase [Solidesulfovibrio aerotolerans]MYL83106.1 metal-dependent hydrolase [Solidesulfovibrio aerotolerans]
MDPVTHAVAGVLIGQAARDRFPTVRALIPLSALAAWMPDVDNIVTFFGPEAYMRYHRGLTHSLLGGALLAWLLAALTARFTTGAKTPGLFILFYFGVLSHLFLDCITSYGTSIFLPFSDARVSFPAVFILDPVYTLALIGLAVAAAWRPAARKKLAVAGLAVMLGWPALGFGVGQAVSAHARTLLVARGGQPTAVIAQPDAFSPLWWKIIAEEGNEYVLTGLSLAAPETLLPERRFERAGRDELERLGREAPVFSQYVWFTDFPVKSAAATPDGAAITFQDLRFMAVNPLVTRMRGTMVPFTLTAYLDGAGRLTRAVFSQMGKGETILPETGLAVAGVEGG